MRNSPASRSFDVSPPGTLAWSMLVLLGGVLPLAIIGTLWLSGRPVHGVLPALVVIPLLLAFLLLAMRRRAVVLAGGMLDVRAALYRKRVATAELDLARARIVDLGERTELRPWLKSNGMAMPGFHAGHFRLRGDFGKAFCLLTQRERVLWLPLQDGKQQLLLSLERPQALLDALRGA
ncbi:hypothetical protein [Thermomonas fusca]|uniref:hypothetical protein n=1 Tax=Thermomonas fusca TaxID=215690 RepID=UPI00048CFE12|nr:hypothetical protein [Thermomonas fusca]